MKGHDACPNEGVETHQFTGRDAEQAFKRLGRWLDEQPPHGRIIGLRFSDVEGEDVWLGTGGVPRPIFVILDWLR